MKGKVLVIAGVFILTTLLTLPVSANQSFSVVVLPDIQHYAEKHPEILQTQIRWVLENRERMNIRFVIFLGDLVQDKDNETQWRRISGIISHLDGVIPYSILPGNHDDGVLYSKYFPSKRYENFTYWGGSYNGNRCSYQFFSGGGENFIVVNLGWNPQYDEIRWSNGVLKRYSNRKAIVVTHGYLNTHGIRDVHGMGDTSFIWEKLVGPNHNVFLVLCGHAHGEARRSDRIDGRVVHQLLANYQTRDNGGNGWLRILEFSDHGIHVRTYSPYLGRYETDSSSDFFLDNSTLQPGISDIMLWNVEKFFYLGLGFAREVFERLFSIFILSGQMLS